MLARALFVRRAAACRMRRFGVPLRSTRYFLGLLFVFILVVLIFVEIVIVLILVGFELNVFVFVIEIVLLIIGCECISETHALLLRSSARDGLAEETQAHSSNLILLPYYASR